MKKILLFLVTFFFGFLAFGQTLSKLWYYDAEAGGIVGNSGSVHNSVAYNKITKKLYVAHRGTGIYIVDPEDYDVATSSLKSTAYSVSSKKLMLPSSIPSSDQYHCSKVRVTDDGVIYAVAMHLSGNIIIYRWENESSTPTRAVVVASATVSGETRTIGRVGDSFAVYGTGDDTYLYVGGSSSAASPTNWVTGQYLTVLKIAGTTPNLVGVFDLAAAQFSGAFMDVGNRSISTESPNVLWLNNHTSGVTGRKITLDLDAGTMTDFAVVNLNSTNFAATYYIKDGTLEYLVSAGATASGSLSQFQNIQLNKIGVTNTGVTPKTIATTALSSVSFGKTTALVNNTGFSDIAHVKNSDNTTTFFFLSANNGLGAFKSNTNLPVSLTTFNASLLNNQSTLTWSTSSESNNKGFEIHRSTDGEDFQSVAFVASKADGGNSSTTLNYTYSDKTAKAGLNYYKLVQIDLDGKLEEFENVKSVNLAITNNSITAYPNPATDQITIDLIEYKGVTLAIFNANGKKVFTEKAKSSQQTISLSQLAPAVYVLRVVKEGQIVQSLKVVKN